MRRRAWIGNPRICLNAKSMNFSTSSRLNALSICLQTSQYLGKQQGGAKSLEACVSRMNEREDCRQETDKPKTKQPYHPKGAGGNTNKASFSKNACVKAHVEKMRPMSI